MINIRSMMALPMKNNRGRRHTTENNALSLTDMHRWLDRLSWAAQKHLHGLRQGQHASLLRGQGLDLVDLRAYQPGDDVRHIDWNTSARLQQTHVRVFHEDRDLAAWFIVDASASNDFGSAGRSKRETAAAYAGIVARMLMRQGNRVGAIVHTGAPAAREQAARMTVLPARGGPQQLWRLTQLLAQPSSFFNEAHKTDKTGQGAKPGKRTKKSALQGQITDLSTMLHEAGRIIRARAAVFVLSDFLGQPGWSGPLAQLAQRHDVVAVHLVDPMEWQLPAAGTLAMRDPETGEQLWVDTDDLQLRTRFAALAAERDSELAQSFARAGVDVLELSTHEDLPLAVVRQTLMRRPGAHGLTVSRCAHV